jgi:hypothetical protein
VTPLAVAVSAASVAVAAFAFARPDSQTTAPALTRLIRFEVPATLTDAASDAACMPSAAAAFRADAKACVAAGGAALDPCFPTARAGLVFCPADPRHPRDDRLVRVMEERSQNGGAALARAWFLELEDGSACRPIPGGGRSIEGAQELYACTFVMAGESDAVVLGDADQSSPVWTIQKAVLNKKATPQTIKSLSIVVVRTAWQ